MRITHNISKKIDKDKLENDLAELFRNIGPKIHCRSNKESTEIIKKAFIKLGEKYNCITCPSATESEYLYDIIWYQSNSNKLESLKSVPLIVESEWDKRFDEIQFDFQKLLIAKSSYKIIIYQVDDNGIESIKKLKSIIDNYEDILESENYYFACFRNSEGSFDFIKNK